MPRPKKQDLMTEKLDKLEKEKPAIEDMPLETLRDYRLYNEEARRLNKQLKMCRYPIKPCPVELHPTERVKFNRHDQPENPLKVYISDDFIDFKKTLIPGNIYDLPKYVVAKLAEKGKPIWGWVDLPADSAGQTKRETRVVAKDPRFSLQTIYANHYE